jgi:acetyl-CoA C-acetyltransferase
MDQLEMIDAAEVVGYLPKGESWKYFRDGKTRFDGEKPINTDGGTQGIGHAFASTGIHNYKEAVLQMRGEAEGRQIPIPPKVVMIRGQGATHSVSIGILRTLEV